MDTSTVSPAMATTAMMRTGFCSLEATVTAGREAELVINVLWGRFKERICLGHCSHGQPVSSRRAVGVATRLLFTTLTTIHVLVQL